MSYPLQAPLSAEEADALAERHLFYRTLRGGAVFASFDSVAARDAAFAELRAARMRKFRAAGGLEVGAEQSA